MRPDDLDTCFFLSTDFSMTLEKTLSPTAYVWENRGRVVRKSRNKCRIATNWNRTAHPNHGRIMRFRILVYCPVNLSFLLSCSCFKPCSHCAIIARWSRLEYTGWSKKWAHLPSNQ